MEATIRIGYARVSTIGQCTESQIEALTAAGCERVFEETASGASRDRPQLAAALTYLRSGDTLVVWKLDRLARSMRQLLDTVEALRDRDIGLQSLTEQLDTTTPGGKLVFHIFGALGEFERQLISERTRAGLEHARRQGRVGGRPKRMTDDDLVAARAMMSSRDMTMEAIAARLGVSPATLYRAFPGGRPDASQ